MIIAHMSNEPFKRYVVDNMDEYLFNNFDPKHKGLFFFGAQALRARGVVDEQYRSLSSTDVIKITRK